MSWKTINKEYIELIKSDVERFKKDYRLAADRVNKSRAIYMGNIIPFLYHPMFFTQEDVNKFEEMVDILMSITNKITEKYLESEEFRKKFGYSPLLEELILIDNGYDINVPIGRYDLFYDDKNEEFKFCEFNTDGSSGMNADNTIANILLETEAMKEFAKKYDFSIFELVNKWVEDIISIYEKWSGNKEKPNIAIVDFAESGITAEFEVFRDAFIKKGYNMIIADPRDLEYREGSLYSGDFKIDLVYRRIVTFELVEKADEIGDFLKAYRDKAFCCVGSIRSQIMHNKVIFKILHDKDTLDFLSEGERDFVRRHIPTTGLFEGDEAIFKKVLNNKDKYIMKPHDLNVSRGVYVGRDMSQETWERKLKEDWNTDYIYQEFFDPFTREHVVFEDDKLTIEEFKSVIGLYIYKEKFAGVYTRIGNKNVISGVTDYYTLPSILVK